MKKIIKLISIIMVICTLFCLMSDHMQNEHKSTITSYTSFNFYDDGGAYADVQITAHLAGGDGTIGMRNELSVDEDCNISSCDWCELGF